MVANAYDTPTHVAGPPTIIPPEAPEEEYEEEEPQKSRVGLAILIGGLIVLALGLGGWGLYRMLNPTNTVEKVDVPLVQGLSEQDAVNLLTQNRLVAEVKKANGPEGTADQITAQDPAAGTNVEVNTTVIITLNEGPKTATIPDGLVGKDRKDVQAELENLGFTNVAANKAKSENPDTQPGEVISISPKEGEVVPLDSKITIRYATGKSEVPNFDGLSQSAAIRVARDAGFDDPVFAERESSKPAGTIIDQNPQAGATVDRDTTIRLTLAIAPAPPSPPPTTESPTDPPTTEPPTQTPSPTPTDTKKPE
jgi:serine/threonine-protein kinase